MSIISNIRNEISKLDFVLSSDSDKGEGEEKVFNPAYTRISEKINDLKQKIIAQLGKDSYTSFLSFVRSSLGKTDRSKVIQMVGEENVGIWLIAENVVHLEKVIMRVPTYIS